MASIEYITKRIEGKKKEIEKLNKKLARIEKAMATDWEVNPYYYNEYDYKNTVKDISKANKDLEKLNADLDEANKKANSRNVPAITEFLENWKDHMRKFYSKEFKRYLVAREEYYEEDRKYCDWFNRERMKATPEQRKAISEEHREYRKEFHSAWAFIEQYVHIDTFETERFEKDIKNEADRKYDFIIERTVSITGTITDATNLKVGEKGDLNGYIIGENGVAKVQTIGAGGYNIQCFHFRTLINKMK